MPDINVNKLSEALNTKADIDLNNTGVFSTNGGVVNLVQSTPSDAKEKEVASADFSLKQGGLELMDVVFAPLGIDETKNKRRYLNGQVIIQEQFPAFTAVVKARMTTMANAFTTEENWQAEKTNSKLGQCGKFVVDDTAGTIRLPCVVNAQGFTDLALIGGIKAESLPIPHHYHSFKVGNGENTAVDPDLGMPTGGIFNTNDAEGFSAPYLEGAPVQQEAIQYPYCIVVNTGVEEPDRPINNYQVNNVYSYGMSQYYKGTMNNNSWLKSAGQWNDGTVYTGMYNWLLEQTNAGTDDFITTNFREYKAGETYAVWTNDAPPVVGMRVYGYWQSQAGGFIGHFPITSVSGNSITFMDTVSNIEKTCTYSKTVPGSIWDSAFVVNQTDQTFRLPLIAERILVAKKEPTDGDYTWYNLYSDGWIEQGGRFYNNANVVNTISFIKPFKNTDYSLLINHGVSGKYGNNVSGQHSDEAWGYTTTNFQAQTYNAVGLNWIVWRACGYAEVPTQSDYTEVSGLYYYIGDTLQNAQLINVARIEEKLTDVNATSRGYVVESYHNGTEWYRIYSDGWIEQGGVVLTGNSATPVTVTFLTPFSDTNYTLQATCNTLTVQWAQMVDLQIVNKTATSFGIVANPSNNNNNWFACGY